MWVRRTWRKIKANGNSYYFHYHLAEKKYWMCLMNRKCRKCGTLAPQNVKVEDYDKDSFGER